MQTREFYPNLKPDWSMTGTVRDLEREMTGFTFKGPGFYAESGVFDGDTFLIVPLDRPLETLWHQDYSPNEVFKILMYHNRDIRIILNILCDAPLSQ